MKIYSKDGEREATIEEEMALQSPRSKAIQKALEDLHAALALNPAAQAAIRDLKVWLT